MMRFSVLLICLALLGSCVQARDLDQIERLRLLDTIRQVHNAQQNTGFVFGMTENGKTVLSDFAGLAVVEHEIQIQPDHRFPVMSITKAIAGLALATAVTAELVDLNTPVSTYLPDYAGEGADTITLRHLATHLSGVPHLGHPARRNLYVQHFPDAASSRHVYEALPLNFQPGSDYGYSSSGYNLIATIIEARAGQNYQAYVREKVLEPLGLEQMDFNNVLVPTPGLVRNYSFVDVFAQPWQAASELQLVPTWDFSYNHGGGNMYASAADLLALGNALLDRSGLDEPIWDVALERSPQTVDTSPWSLGWIHGKDAQGRRTIYITGATPGVQAALYVYPEQRIVFAALANSWGKNSAGADLVIGAPQRIVNEYLSGAAP
ncbi:MAG: beta-lactamase family protein [Gammaproteobacteria bacterium]|nr:beta-lactamase family protein [Gammaproteobacteria bacterium]